MKRHLLLASLVALAVLPAAAASGAPTPSVVYNAVPSPLPGNVPSVGFQATQTSQFGDYVHLGGTARTLGAVTVTMSDWALYADYSLDARYLRNKSTWTHPITLNVYSSHLGTDGAPDTLLGTTTETVTIPWRPKADPACATTTAPTGWKASDGQCYNGKAFNVTFNMSSLNVTLPSDVIIGIAYNTQSYGTAPIGSNGPYNSLNVGVPTGQTASVGTDDSANNVFWNTSTAASYADGGTAGVGTFRQDTKWSPNGTVAFMITATAPLVGPPTSMDQCKNGGWATFNAPSFKSQGGCEQFVQTSGAPGNGGHHDQGGQGSHSGQSSVGGRGGRGR